MEYKALLVRSVVSIEGVRMVGVGMFLNYTLSNPRVWLVMWFSVMVTGMCLHNLSLLI